MIVLLLQIVFSIANSKKARKVETVMEGIFHAILKVHLYISQTLHSKTGSKYFNSEKY